jgi:cytochrome c oxidase subunit 2
MQTDSVKQKFGAKLKKSLLQLRSIHIDPLELKWVTITLGMAALFVSIIMIDALVHGIHAPSNVQTIDSARLHLSEEFAEDKLGVEVNEQGQINVRMVAGRYSFFPKHIEVPAEKPITFRWVSLDVLHGVHIPMTNMSTMIVPGYVSQITTSFPKPGEYPLLCNEYCGLGHNHMWSNISVVAKEDWIAPAKSPAKGESENE